MRKKRLARQQQTSSALVITMLGVVLLTIIVVAFMQTMSLSLGTSKSYADIQRATLAAQAGLDTAVAQLTLATGTNVAFVTGVTNFPSTNTPLTVIGEGNLTNQDQMMPLASGPLTYLTNYGSPGFAANFSAYASLRTSSDPAQSVDVNTPYQFIQVTSDTNAYRASWVNMTNMVGSKVSYSRFAYVVLDDTARVNPALMTGNGTGFANSTNWYTGPRDIALTNANSISRLLTASQMSQVTGASTSNSFQYSDATLGETFAARADYEAVKHLFTSQTNASFDVIPAWLTNGGMPKYNINDLATNPVYGATPMLRAQNIANIITNNFTNFYMRDPALNATNKALYVNRLAANMVAYISPDSTWPATEYTTNTTGISPQVSGIFPVFIVEQVYAPTATSAAGAFWVSCWNPNTTPVTITNAVFHVWHRPSYYLGNAAVVTPTPAYLQTNSFISNVNRVVRPNEFITLGFPAMTNAINTTGKTLAFPKMIPDANNGVGGADGNTPTPPYEQYSLTINGQTVAQTANQPTICGLQNDGLTLSTASQWECMGYDDQGSIVGDPRFQNYQYTIWEATHDFYNTATYWNGCQPAGSSWYPWTAWTSRDNIARPPARTGNKPPDNIRTPDQLLSAYTATDASGAPEVIRNGPMVSIGELGHIFDPAYANDQLTAVSPNHDKGGYSGAFLNGGGRSLRIGRPESTGATTSVGSPTAASWDKTGERAISLLDLFTVNNTNLVSGGSVGRINPNTASTNVLAAVFSGIQITSDTSAANTLTNFAGLAQQVVDNRPYSSLSDLYKITPAFDTGTNYSSNYTNNGAGYINVPNRVHQEAFGKLVQHLTVQSRSYRIYVIGQVLDSSQNPHGSVAMEAGVYLQYNQALATYQPVIQYVRFLK